VHDVVAVVGADGLGQVRVVTARVDDDLVTEAGEPARQLGDVDVLTARVHRADGRERACVLGNQSNSHAFSLVAGPSSLPDTRGEAPQTPRKVTRS